MSDADARVRELEAKVAQLLSEAGVRQEDDSALVAADGGTATQGPSSAGQQSTSCAQGATAIGPDPSLAAFDQWIITADHPTRAKSYTKVRKELVRQNEFMRERQHLRESERREQILKPSLSALSIATGVGLIAGGFTYPGLFVLGAGLYWLAPSYVDKVSKRIFGDGSGTT